MIISGLKKGGRERRMLELIKGLLRCNKNFEICLVSLSETIEYSYVYDLPISFHVIDKKVSRTKIQVALKVRRIINGFQPDVIHSWDVTSSGYLSLSNLALNIPVVQGVIYDASTKSELAKSIRNRIKILAPFSSVFVANSMAGIKAYNPPAHKSICIYNGIDLTRFNGLKDAEQVKKEIIGDHDGTKFVAAMVAAFEERKDYDTLLEAAITICKKDKDIVFLLIGQGENLQRIKEKTPTELLQKQIIFTGVRNDVESIMQIINVGLLITNSQNHGEGISNTIIEYMSSRKPVIATRGGGTDEVVKDGLNGFLIDPHNPEQIIEKIETFRNDNQLAIEMGEKGYLSILQNFEIGRMTDEYISLYKKLQKKKKEVRTKEVNEAYLLNISEK